MTPTLVAHAGGFGWDELLVMAVPVGVVVALQVIGRRKARAAAADAPSEGDQPEHRPAAEAD